MKFEGKSVFLYGKFYDANRESEGPSPTSHYDVIVYVNPERSSRAFSSLEGVFVSDIEDPFLDNVKGDPLCMREQMDEFEVKYDGKFIPFQELSPTSSVAS